MSTSFQLSQEERKKDLIAKLNAAEELTFQQLERAIAVVDRANVKEHQATLLGPVLNAIVSNME